eukprot:10531001-Ditylum_brightwellii.AAC.1
MPVMPVTVTTSTKPFLLTSELLVKSTTVVSVTCLVGIVRFSCGTMNGMSLNPIKLHSKPS